jgi:hypothetical protein
MERTLATVTIATVMLFAPQVVLAQNSPQDQTQGSVPEQVKNGLEKSGFTNIQGVPDVVLVRAKDPHGNPVTLVVNTDTFKDMTNESGIVHLDLQEGQTTGKSAKMTDSPENSSSPNEASQSTDQKSEKMTVHGPQQAQPLTLTNTQREAIWQKLGHQPTQTNPTGHNLNIGQVVPNGLSLQALPGNISAQVPAVKSYDYAMLDNQLLIIDPSTKRVVAIVAD